ncbi:type II toxin-antitoxin system VapC family toxin [Candidatus Woesearchaeota archaeon]|nr:type II toxin-antitoxin system VapC family toxin [Candidatus Woesearchaeota archaeon]
MEEKKTYYLDANVFIYAILNDLELGNKCREILRQAHLGKFKCITSCLTFDEILWNVRKIRPKEFNNICSNILNLNIKFVEVNKIILHKMTEILKKYDLKPRDTLHLATMYVNNCKEIISEDDDFDVVEEIKRTDIMDFRM